MEQILKQILEKLNSMETDIKELKAGQAKLEKGQAKLEAGQAKLEAGQAKLEKGQQEIKAELKFMWDDIKKLDNRLSAQENEVFTLKRIK
ncbi:hypothetical protein M2651_05575 [Clostridium sp. SYSU_GA19001]|uniref:hypothetical protein n=1 Tax=Clostridium caldaquaticum TaxID=2940653 RepID=UPI002077892F|nr:hypothetical protein [Clostridium caldaquaticum]MCM8710494.1 hypothetical protein [Clostridium caldaquaticum]